MSTVISKAATGIFARCEYFQGAAVHVYKQF